MIIASIYALIKEIQSTQIMIITFLGTSVPFHCAIIHDSCNLGLTCRAAALQVLCAFNEKHEKVTWTS